MVASDGKADSAAYTVTFAKKVTKATITLAAPLAADDAISVMVMNIVGTLPADAVMEVLVTNNAKDTTPVWEDARRMSRMAQTMCLPIRPPPTALRSTSSSLLSVEPATPAAIFLTSEVLLNNGCLL